MVQRDSSVFQGQMPKNSAMLPPPIAWYIHVEGKNDGPHVLTDIQRMIGKSQIRDSDLVFVVGGDAWTSAGNDPILGRLFAGHALPEPRRPKASSRVVFVAVCGLALVWCAWPYYAVHRLFNAIRHADVAELENRVAWQDLRQSLRGDLNAIFLQSAQERSNSQEAWGNALASFIVPAMIDRLVDNYVTPQSVALAIQNGKKEPQEKAEAVGSGKPSLQDEVRKIPELDWKQVQYAFFAGSPLQFRIDVIPKGEAVERQPIGFLFSWSGDWKLVRVFLPTSFSNLMASADKSIKEVPQPVKKPEPQPPKFDPRQVAPLLDKTSEDTPQQKQASISEADPAWQVVEDKSPIDDSPQVAAALNSKAGNLQLVMRCKERQVEVAVIAREGLGMNFRNEIKVLFRLNDLPAQTVTWTESKTGKAAFSPAPRSFVTAIGDGRLFARVFAHNSREIDDTFELKDTSSVRDKILGACPNTQKNPPRPN